MTETGDERGVCVGDDGHASRADELDAALRRAGVPPGCPG
jgi:hypothetical protein